MKLKTNDEVEVMAKSGAILRSILDDLVLHIRPGISTLAIDERARVLVEQHGVKAAFLGYNGFPAAVCVSINDEVVHGIPSSKRILNYGDIVGIDMGVIYKNYYSDSARTVPVIDNMNNEQWQRQFPSRHKLIEVTRDALNLGIEAAIVGNRIGAIGHAIQKHVESHRFGVVRELVGHGIGLRLHEDPHVPNFGGLKDGPILKAGMVLAIEPMVTAGSYEVRLDADNWTYRTADGSDSAHFEHTVAVTKDGPVILTEA